MDGSKTASLGDALGVEYVVLLAQTADIPAWQAATHEVKQRGLPIRSELLPETSGTVYEREAAVIVRPDQVVADHVRMGEPIEQAQFLANALPIPT